jgi:hypothetical protein
MKRTKCRSLWRPTHWFTPGVRLSACEPDAERGHTLGVTSARVGRWTDGDECSQDSGGRTLTHSGCISCSGAPSHPADVSFVAAALAAPLTSGRTWPQRLQRVQCAFVMLSDAAVHVTPADADGADGAAQRQPVPGTHGGSSTNPGRTVHT